MLMPIPLLLMAVPLRLLWSEVFVHAHDLDTHYAQQQVGANPCVTVPTETLDDLTDGVALFEVMAEMYVERWLLSTSLYFLRSLYAPHDIAVTCCCVHSAPDIFDLSYVKRDVKDNARLKERNVRELCKGISEYYQFVCA